MSQPQPREPAAHPESHVSPMPPDRPSHVRPRRTVVEAFGNSDVGLVRERNEDSYAVLRDLGLFMVADGMGGGKAGDVASRMTIDCVREALENEDMTWPVGMGERSKATPSELLLVAGLQRANAHLFNLAQRNVAMAGMGTTFSGLVLLDDRVVIAQVGDSRIYRLRGDELTQLTTDHTLLEACIRAGQWRREEADVFPARHVITRAIGTHEEIEVDTLVDEPAAGDVYLICSDGLHGLVHEQQIRAVLRRECDLTRAVGLLISLALDGGGTDNVTAVLMRIVATGTR